MLVGWLAAGVILGSGISMVILRGGGDPPHFPMACAFVLLVELVLLLWCGRQVRRFTSRQSSRVSAVTASRVAAFALAACYSGMLLLGLFAMLVMLYWTSGSTEYIRDQVLSVGLAALASFGLVIGGLVVERWCRLDDSGDDVASGSVGTTA